MEQSENTQTVENVQESPYQNSGVSFPTVGEPKKSGGIKTLLIIGVLVLVAILGFVIYKSAGNNVSEDEPTPTSFENLTTPSNQVIPTLTPAPSATAAAVKTDKTKVAIQVQNGTGVTGEAAYLQTQLSNLGYTNVKVGNSETNVTATSVTFMSTIDAAVVTEITQKLNSIYQTVSSKTASTGTFDIVIVTGLRKGATAKPSVAGTSTPTTSRTPTPTPTPTRSPTPSASPTP